MFASFTGDWFLQSLHTYSLLLVARAWINHECVRHTIEGSDVTHERKHMNACFTSSLTVFPDRNLEFNGMSNLPVNAFKNLPSDNTGIGIIRFVSGNSMSCAPAIFSTKYHPTSIFLPQCRVNLNMTATPRINPCQYAVESGCVILSIMDTVKGPLYL